MNKSINYTFTFIIYFLFFHVRFSFTQSPLCLRSFESRCFYKTKVKPASNLGQPFQYFLIRNIYKSHRLILFIEKIKTSSIHDRFYLFLNLKPSVTIGWPSANQGPGLLRDRYYTTRITVTEITAIELSYISYVSYYYYTYYI